MKMITENLKFIDVFPDKAKEYAKKLHIKKDEIPFVRKSYISELKESNDKERTVTAMITTDIKDRDGEVLDPKGMIKDNYEKNKIVLWGHSYEEPQHVIGKNRWIKPTTDGKAILAQTIFRKNQFADEVYKLYTEDMEGTGPVLKGWSVGFIPLEWEDGDEKKKDVPKRKYTKWELLEYSAVPIPSNPDALTLAYQKGFITSDRLKKDLEIEVVKDVEIEVVKKDRKIEVVKEDYIDPGKEILDAIDDPELKKSFWFVLFDGLWQGYYDPELADPSKMKDIRDKYFNFIEVELLKEAITKPETTDQYHRIPISTGHSGHRIRTIIISASQGIKALYCGECKKVITYLFDVKKWTMSEAQAWVREHKSMAMTIQTLGNDLDDFIGHSKEEIKEPEYKERWNKSLSKVFDVASVEAPIATFNYALYEKFLECKVKEIFLNSYSVPGPLLGTYLAGFKKILGDFKLKDSRSFTWDGGEVPPISEMIKLNSEKSDDFLINGVCFYDADNKPLIVRFSSGWYGIDVSIVTSSENKEWNKELLDKVHDWVHENNYLKGEKFSLSGEFLDEPDDNWDNLILDAKYKDSIIKSANFLEKKGKDLTGRGLLFIGPPGTGKTKTGRVLMNELDATFIWVSSRDFRHIGPLKALSLGFSLARDLAPSILFLEDIDTWLRGEMEFVTDLVKTEMDGIKQNKGLITIMTSNYPEKLPDALLDRPGRFHHIINFELPKEKERKEMLVLWAGDIEEKLLDDIVEKTEGFSGAHLKELVEFAKMIAEEDEMEIGDALLKSLEKLIEQRELIEEIRENKTDSKQFWGKVKWADKDIKVKADREIEVETDEMITEESLRLFVTDGLIQAIPSNLYSYKERLEFLKEVRKMPRLGYHDVDEFYKDEGERDEPIDYTSLEFAIKGLTDEVAELKEGRVLSTKNRTLVKDVRDLIRELDGKLTSLLDATEPPSREEEKEAKKVVVLEKGKPETDPTKKIADIFETLISSGKMTEMFKKAMDDALDVNIKKRLGKVE